MSPTAGLLVVDVVAGLLLIVAGAALAYERRPDDPHYTPRHRLRPPTDELTLAVSASRRAVRRSIAPWAASTARTPLPGHPRPNVTVTKPVEETEMDLKKIAVRAVVTAVQAVLAVLVAAGTTDLNVETAQAALMAGVAALLSVAYNAANQYLESSTA